MNPRIIEEFLSFMVSCERKSHALASVLKWLFLLTYTIIVLPILALRSRHKPNEVGSTGAADDDDGAKEMSRNSAIGNELSPPTKSPPTKNDIERASGVLLYEALKPIVHKEIVKNLDEWCYDFAPLRRVFEGVAE